MTSATDDLSPVPVSRSDRRPLTTAPPPGVRARRLVLLGDSTGVGLGDRRPDGTWRGVGPLLAESLGIDSTSSGYLNTATTGARVATVRTEQLRRAVRHRPDIAVLVVGMNDTLRSDFDADRLAADLDSVVTTLRAAGSLVLLVRFHDHARVFWLPGPLAAALRSRIDELNAVVDRVTTGRPRVASVDVGNEPRTYEMRSWSVDRLHPSERGHRLLARGFGERIAEAGFAVPFPVSLRCYGGRQDSTLDHVGWLVAEGVPWLWRRGRDLLPYAAALTARSLVRTTGRTIAGDVGRSVTGAVTRGGYG